MLKLDMLIIPRMHRSSTVTVNYKRGGSLVLNGLKRAMWRGVEAFITSLGRIFLFLWQSNLNSSSILIQLTVCCV